ncbi:MFS general substrate transporter [Trichodelitschia bisporula]|uniref:MFS general substrate transporter n=1 Tax=Trichodelitschia bisporula TaxID=703511 RepID=A0A6G1I0X1_9PEZI|nr:MFS general substrate transporter [Trichodelitschia bisporula]
MAEASHRTARFVAVAAATVISLACGTNYAYSAWAPQFAERLKLTATQSNLIGSAGNLGMYASGVPLGYMVDHKGPRWGVLIGGLTLGFGYYPIKTAFDAGPGSMGMVMLIFMSFLTGFGSCSAFQASIKTAALNWPTHRGTATAFPLAAFGLSAFFFTSVAGVAFPGDTSKYLLLLALGTTLMVFASFVFIRVPHPEDYHALATGEPRPSVLRRDSNPLHQPTSWNRSSALRKSPDAVPEAIDASARPSPLAPRGGICAPYSLRARENSCQLRTVGESSESGTPDELADEVSSLLSGSSGPGDIEADEMLKRSGQHHSHRPDISGLQLLPKIDFWLLWSMLGILTGIGLMTINNIGSDTQALWYFDDPDASKKFVADAQLIHVSIISIMSFVGRLASGIGSDFLVKRLHKSRFWCLVCSSSIFAAAQFAGYSISNPRYLWVLSTLSGLAYGALFGVYPALVADAFGVSGLSVNWGFMTLAPVVFGNIFNLAYGAVFDGHSRAEPDGELICQLGLECYRRAYGITILASGVGILVSVGSAWRDRGRWTPVPEVDDHQA